jgi:hypothetical protein
LNSREVVRGRDTKLLHFVVSGFSDDPIKLLIESSRADDETQAAATDKHCRIIHAALCNFKVIHYLFVGNHKAQSNVQLILSFKRGELKGKEKRWRTINLEIEFYGLR